MACQVKNTNYDILMEAFTSNNELTNLVEEANNSNSYVYTVKGLNTYVDFCDSLELGDTIKEVLFDYFNQRGLNIDFKLERITKKVNDYIMLHKNREGTTIVYSENGREEIIAHNSELKDKSFKNRHEVKDLLNSYAAELRYGTDKLLKVILDEVGNVEIVQ